MRVKILSISSVAFEGDIRSASIPTASGRITVLSHHEPILSALVPGVLTIVDSEENILHFAIGGGVLRVSDEILTILADMAEDGAALNTAEIESRRAQLADEIAAARGSDKPEDIERLVAMEEEYVRESARLQASR
ncbi:MAG TPA: ATP synthase F1 subunit epsilon [bacterium]|nr:ATP synthase F1 subunit epsilon [bacterium]